MVEIVIGGDVIPLGRTLPLFRSGNAAALFDGLVDVFKHAQLSIVNLEGPLTEGDQPIPKDGPNLKASSDCIEGIKQAGIGVLGLANNHIFDYGPKGLADTLDACRKAGLATVGAGRNVSEASQILCCSVGGMRIGILAIAEHEFSIATEYSAGANPFDLISFVRSVRQHEAEYDYLIVLFHGGKEGVRYPSPRVMEVCRFFIEQGADAVICQHSHCVGCHENYQGGHIVYGQGNLVFDWQPSPGPAWHEGLLVRLRIREGGGSGMDFIPYRQCDAHPGARAMDAKEEAAFRREWGRRSREIADPEFVRQKWIDYCRSQARYYLSKLCGHSRLRRYLNAKIHLEDWLRSPASRMMQRNVVECEAHREVLETLWRYPI